MFLWRKGEAVTNTCALVKYDDVDRIKIVADATIALRIVLSLHHRNPRSREKSGRTRSSHIGKG